MSKELLYHKEPLQAISNLRKSIGGTFQKDRSPLNNIRAQIHPFEKSYKVLFQGDIFDLSYRKLRVGQYHKNVKFHYKGNTLIFNSVYLRQNAMPKFEGIVDFFQPKDILKTPSIIID